MRTGKRIALLILLMVLIPGCLERSEKHPESLALIKIEGDEWYSNETVTFNGSSSIGHKAEIIDYQWNIMNSSFGMKDTVNGETVEYEFTRPGRYHRSFLQ